MSILDDFKPIIDKKIENSNVPAIGIYFLLKEKYGYPGKYGIVKNYVSSKKKNIINELTIRFETIKGYQSQVDWKEKLFNFEKNKISYLNNMKNSLEKGKYDGGKYNIFLVYEPKVRVVMSQSVYDKTINHYITRYILMPKLEKYLYEYNCATRKGKGLDYAIISLKKFIQKYKLKGDVYFIKLDIIEKVLDSTNKEYVNYNISKLESKIKEELPKYNKDKGLPIGSLSS